MNRFIAIDFETANKFPLSACALGVVVFEDGIEVLRRSWLLKPPSPYDVFDPINIRIHGTTADMVALAPNFADIFPTIEPYLHHSVVIAHNADFDIGILRTLMNYYHFDMNKVLYGCTVQLSRQAFSGFPNHKLNTVAHMLGFPLNHHDALSDALACANILLTIMVGLNQYDVVNCFKDLGVSLKQII